MSIDDRLYRMAETLARIDANTAHLKDRADRRDQDDRSIEKRLRRLENRQHWYSGIAAALGAMFGVGGSQLFKP